MKADDICPRHTPAPQQSTAPLATPITLASVWQCSDPDQAGRLMAGELPGYVYNRDGHPNADAVAEKCRELHQADHAAVVASGMGAMALALVSQCRHGDHLVLSNRLYGKSFALLRDEAQRLGIDSSIVDTCDIKATESAITSSTKLLVVETITNPTLRVSDLAALAEVAHRHGAKLLVDNTFASPALCRPLALGADLVLESLTKIMNGHSDALLGLLCGNAAAWERVPACRSAWGLTPGPFECWLVERGLGTLHLRVERANANAMAAAEFLAKQPTVETVYYPGLPDHPDHALADKQFGGRFGAMVAFNLSGGVAAATKFIASAKRIPFCPSLGELCTTLSHPESTSHRVLTPEQREALGITGGTIRLSVGTESPEFVVDAIAEGLRGLN